jgi:hypothetical protein
VRVPTRGATQLSSPYTDIELCFDAQQSQVSLARSVAAEIVAREGAEPCYVEKVRHVVGMITGALVVLAHDDTQVQCLFRTLDGEIRVRASVESAPFPSPEAKGEHARLLDQLLVSASTFTHPNESGGFTVVSDAFVPLEH